MKPSHLAKQVACGLAVLTLLVVWTGQASAQVLYVTSNLGSSISSVDASTQQIISTFSTMGVPDSLMFDTNGNIIYTAILAGEVRLYNTTTHADTLIAGGFVEPADIALEPSGGSMLVSDYVGGTIWRINLTPSYAKTQLLMYPAGNNPMGIAFDSAGHLFVVSGNPNVTLGSYVAQLNPSNGAVLQITPKETNLDGLVYDAFSGKLYATAQPSPGTGIYQIDPANFTSAPILLPNTTGLPLDGLTTDSAGNLYVAAYPGTTSGQIYKYNLVTQAPPTPNAPITYIDDLAPLTGLGSQNGYVEICKQSDPEHPVTGSFNFTVSNGGFNQGPISVPVGQCSGSIQVPSGAVTVTETPVSGVAVSNVTAIAYDELGFQQNELMSWTQPNLNATVGVMPGDQDEETIATFTNYTADPGLLKICKVAGDKSTLGVPFTFTVIAGGQTYTYVINAGPASQGGNCVVAGSFPVSTQVTITESAAPGYFVTNIAVNEGQLQSCQPAGSCFVATTIPGITEVTYTNNHKRKRKR